MIKFIGRRAGDTTTGLEKIKQQGIKRNNEGRRRGRKVIRKFAGERESETDNEGRDFAD